MDPSYTDPPGSLTVLEDTLLALDERSAKREEEQERLENKSDMSMMEFHSSTTHETDTPSIQHVPSLQQSHLCHTLCLCSTLYLLQHFIYATHVCTTLTFMYVYF